MNMKQGLSAGALSVGVLSAGGAAQATTFLFTDTVQTFDVTTTPGSTTSQPSGLKAAPKAAQRAAPAASARRSAATSCSPRVAS
jgi:hypothetical protein